MPLTWVIALGVSSVGSTENTTTWKPDALRLVTARWPSSSELRSAIAVVSASFHV